MNQPDDDLTGMARNVIDANRYLTLGTAEPDGALVIFDSTAPVGQGRAVYLGARASMVADDELPQRCAEAFAQVGPGAVRFQPEELSGDAGLRLYRAGATSHEVHIPGRDPVHGTGVDTRRRVSL